MQNNKKDITQFFVWMRNGIAFCTSWFLILWVLYNRSSNIESISTDRLTQMLLFVFGGVFLFSVSFTRILLKKWRFLTRLTCFMILFSAYECVVFYATGFWSASGTFSQWLGFVGLILVLYLLCIAIYQAYSKKQGELYTMALQKYQQKRSSEYGK